MRMAMFFLFKPQRGDILVENKIHKNPERCRCDIFCPHKIKCRLSEAWCILTGSFLPKYRSYGAKKFNYANGLKYYYKTFNFGIINTAYQYTR